MNQESQTIDLTPTPAGTMRIWATVLRGAVHNIRARKGDTAISMIESVVDDLLMNASKLQSGARTEV